MSNKRRIPKLRFEEFINSSNWEEKKLGKIISVNMCKRIFNDQTTKIGDIPFYKIGTFGKVADAFISNDLFQEYKSKYKYPKENEILISCSGTVGKTVVFDGSDSYFQDSNIVWLDNDELIVKNELLYYIVNKFTWSELSSTTIKRIYSTDINLKAISTPTSLEEQEKIAKFLYNLDNRIEKQQELIEKYKELKKGYLQKLFPKKGKNIPELRFDDFIKCVEWKKVKVSDVFKITRGFVLSKDRMEISEHLYPVYSSQTSNKGIVGYYSEYLFEDSITWTTDGANAGDVNFRKGKFYCTNVCGVLINKDGYSNKCIAEIINSVSRKYVSYVGNPKLMNNVMADIIIKVPIEIEEQKKVSILIDNIDCIIDNNNFLKEQLNNQKTFYLSKLLI